MKRNEAYLCCDSSSLSITKAFDILLAEIMLLCLQYCLHTNGRFDHFEEYKIAFFWENKQKDYRK